MAPRPKSPKITVPRPAGPKAASKAARKAGSKEVGKRVVASLRRSLAERLAEAWRSDPERLANAVELGIINPDWVEAPTAHSFSSAAPIDVVERFLQRTTEQRPSMLASLGLSALQVLGSADADDQHEGRAATLAVMFTDLEGFTAFTEAEGDEVASRLLAQHHKAVGPVVRNRGGRLVKHLGDGLLLTFPSAEAAVLAGLELGDCAPPPLRLRAGVHLGEILVTRDDVVGHVVNLAARVTDRAAGDELLVTAAVRDAVDGLPGVTFGRVRRLRLKGVAERLGVCRVEDQRRRDAAAPTPLV